MSLQNKAKKTEKMIDKSRPYVIDLRKGDPSTEREKDNNSQSLQRIDTGFVVQVQSANS